jgi:hypothetical protein
VHHTKLHFGSVLETKNPMHNYTPVPKTVMKHTGSFNTKQKILHLNYLLNQQIITKQELLHFNSMINQQIKAQK